VFLLNSRYLFLYEIINKLTTLLLPKLQSDFAEFLQLPSLIAAIYSTNPPVSVFIYYTSSYFKTNTFNTNFKMCAEGLRIS